MFQTGFAENIKQPMISKKIKLQPCLDLQVAESGNHYEEEDIQRYFDLQQEVFPYSFIDPFVDYMESLSSSNVKLFLSKGGWSFPSFAMNFDIPWVPLSIICKSEVLPVSQIFVWLHWKHDFT